MLKFIKYGLLFVLATSPWAFGSVEPWAYSIINLSALLFLILWSIHRLFLEDRLGPNPPRPGGRKRRSATTPADLRPNRPNRLFVFYPLLAFIAVVLFQLLPLPVSMVRILSPARQAYLDKLNINSFGLPIPSHLKLSVDPHLTTLAFTNLLCLLIYLFLIIQLLHSLGDGPNRPNDQVRLDPADARADEIDETTERLNRLNRPNRPNRPDGFLNQLAFTIIAIGFLLAVFGIIQKLSGAQEIYWFRRLTRGGSLMGPFVNRDHFAGYLEMPLGLALGVFIFMRRQAPYRWLLGLAAVVMGAAIFYSGSRGGVLCFLFELLCAGILGFAFRPNRSATMPADLRPNRLNRPNRPLASLLLIPVLLILVILAISYIGPEAILGRLNEGITKVERLSIWTDTLAIARNFPVFGCGFGTFRNVFPAFQANDYSTRYLQSHNDYAQVLSETGLLGGLLLVVSLVLLGLKILRQEEGSSSFRQSVRLGALVGILGILLHTFFDFNLQIPATALQFMTLCALVLL